MTVQTSAGAGWSGCLGVEGQMTGDGRLIQAGALRWENLPIPLRYVPVDSGQHDGAQVVGLITSITRGENGKIMAAGTFDIASDVGLEAQRHVSEGLTTGVSLDLDDVSFEIRVAADVLDKQDAMMMDLMGGDDEGPAEPHAAPDADGKVTVATISSTDEVMVTTDARVRAATIVAIPAFVNARLAVGASPVPVSGAPVTAPSASTDAPIVGKKSDGSDCSCDENAPDFDPDCDCTQVLAAEVPEPVPAISTGKKADGSDCSCDEANASYDPDCDCSQPSPPPGAPNSTVKAVLEPGVNLSSPEGEGTPVLDEVSKGLLPDGVTECSCDETDPAYDPDCVCAEAEVPPVGQEVPPAADVAVPPVKVAVPVEVAVVDPEAGFLPDGITPCSCDPAMGNYDEACVKPAEGALVAAATPKLPPAKWFDNPRLTAPTAMKVTADGRVYGHIATWNTCHIANSDMCVQAPHSASGYAYFHTGAILTDAGERAVGHLTLDTVHAGPRLTAAGAALHYEDTGTVVANVRAGEDEYGIWVAGAIRYGATEAQVQSLRAAPVSGDWRTRAGVLELVAALAVNVPGFPIPRPAGMVASGEVVSLVASGMIPPRRVVRPGTAGALSLTDLKYLKALAARERANTISGLATRVKTSKVRAFASRRKGGH